MKLKNLFLLVSSMALTMSLSLTFLDNKNVEKVYASDDEIYLGLGDGVGYIGSTREIIMEQGCGIYIPVNVDYARETNIFYDIQHGDYVNEINTINILDSVTIDYPTYFFANMPNLEKIENLGNLNTSGAEDFSYFFYNSPKVSDADFSEFDTSSAQNFHEMFSGTSFESLDLSNFKTRGVGKFSNMFKDCTNLSSLNVSSFDTYSASSLERMFSNCPKLKCLDISSFDLSNRPIVENIFHGTQMDVLYAPENLIQSDQILYTFSFYLPLRYEIPDYYYDVKLNNYSIAKESEQSITYYFYNIKEEAVDFANEFNNIVSTLFTSGECNNLEKLREDWASIANYLDTWEYEYKEHVLDILKAADSDSPIEIMRDFAEMYDFAYNNYYGALYNKGGDFLDRCPHAEDKDGFVHIGVDTDNNIGYLASFDTYEILSSDIRWKVKLGVDTFIDSIFSSNSYTGYTDIEQVIVQDEVEIKNAEHFFKGLSSVSSIEGVENLDTSLSQSYESMFEDCTSLFTLDLSELNAENVTTTASMFKDCSNLSELQLPTTFTTTLKEIHQTFFGCKSLVTIDLSKLDLRNVLTTTEMLYGTSFCYLLTPKVMPTAACNIELIVPITELNYSFYDISFNTYTVLPKDKSSFLIVSENGKRILGSFLSGFEKECERYCEEDGSTSETSLTKLWEDQSEDFNDHIVDSPHHYLVDFFKQDNSSCPYVELKEFCERYDYIYGKYQDILDNHGGDFASRRNLISFNNYNPLSLTVFNESNAILYISVALFSVAFISVLFLIKRKRENR